MIRVLFLNPPYFRKFSRSQRSPAVTRSGTLYYPMWLSYSAAVLQKEGFEINLIDAPAEGLGLKDVILRTVKFQPDLIILNTSTPSIYNDIHVGEEIGEALPSAKIILVGTHVSALPGETLLLSEKIDGLARREYDYTIRELAFAISENRDWSEIKGLSYRAPGEIIHNPDRPFIENLDEIPFVTRIYKQFLKCTNYFNPNALYPMVAIVAGRGCPFGCSFCVYPQTMTGTRYRYREPENILEEIKYIEKEFPEVKSIFFEDDTLTADRKRCLRLMELIQKEKVSLSWTANSRADLDYGILKEMKKAGCRCLCVGFEAGDEKLLRKMHKGINLDKAIRFMRDARACGILIHGCFIFGSPGETNDTMKKTLRFAIKLNPDTAQFYPIMVYPGTKAYRDAEEMGHLDTKNYSKWLDSEGHHSSVISTVELSSDELVSFCSYARRAFYLRFSYILKKLFQILRQPQETERILKASKTFLKNLLTDLTKSKLSSRGTSCLPRIGSFLT